MKFINRLVESYVNNYLDKIDIKQIVRWQIDVVIRNFDKTDILEKVNDKIEKQLTEPTILNMIYENVGYIIVNYGKRFLDGKERHE